MINGKDVKAGDVFRFEDKVWRCTKNDGFIFSADNTDENDSEANFMWIGIADKFEVELI